MRGITYTLTTCAYIRTHIHTSKCVSSHACVCPRTCGYFFHFYFSFFYSSQRGKTFFARFSHVISLIDSVSHLMCPIPTPSPTPIYLPTPSLGRYHIANAMSSATLWCACVIVLVHIRSFPLKEDE